MAASRILTVRAVLGDEQVERFDAHSEISGGWDEPHYSHQPAAVRVSRQLTLFFGTGSKSPQRSKWLRGVVPLSGDDPTETEWTEATNLARSRLAESIHRHGLDGA